MDHLIIAQMININPTLQVNESRNVPIKNQKTESRDILLFSSINDY